MAEFFAGGGACVDLGAEFHELFGDGSVECYHCRCAIGCRAYGSEFESVAGECEWGCTVSVGVVKHYLRYLRYIEPQAFFA